MDDLDREGLEICRALQVEVVDVKVEYFSDALMRKIVTNRLISLHEAYMSAADKELWERLLKFVREETRTRKNISGDTDIAHDLGVDGDDALEFMLAFQREFNVDLSNFRFNLHFGSEGFDLISAIEALVRKKGGIPVTIFILFYAAKSSRWPELDQPA
ncbi:Protein of unknown function [Filomicrobium insigne]|uniref:Carrier domain-containing protein n=1 Tax=Filomicrobium insigne TaxID=418854 RepID=A0A1H0QL47_9HYPH|nr:Protein of unknown function [Filomicrobium insigne]